MKLVIISESSTDVRDPHGYFAMNKKVSKKEKDISPVKGIKVVESEMSRPKRRNSKKRISRKISKNLQFDRNNGVLEISKNTMSEICKYHKNMARNHPQTFRSKLEQEKRDKNTQACRLSRRAKKLEEIIMEEQYRDDLKLHEKITEETARSVHYMKKLLEMLGGN